jgi:hypothetical protein
MVSGNLLNWFYIDGFGHIAFRTQRYEIEKAVFAHPC